jgi:serine/threonine-protein kinase
MAKEPFQRFDTCREFAAALARGGGNSVGPNDVTQLAVSVPTYSSATPPEQAARTEPNRVSPSRRPALIAGGVVAALIAVGAVAFVGARLGQPQPTPPAASSEPSSALRPATTLAPPRTVTQTAPPVTVTPSGSRRVSIPPAAGDLGLSTPMSYPTCNGQGIVILGSVTTPGLYAAGVQRLLDANPGAFYLRTDQTCPSLRPATAEGNPIYAVFDLGGTTTSQVCTAVHAEGGNAYGKWLDTTTDPGYIIPC